MDYMNQSGLWFISAVFIDDQKLARSDVIECVRRAGRMQLLLHSRGKGVTGGFEANWRWSINAVFIDDQKLARRERIWCRRHYHYQRYPIDTDMLQCSPGRMQFFLHSQGKGVTGGSDSDGDPVNESIRTISADEARAWIHARSVAGDRVPVDQSVRTISTNEARAWIHARIVAGDLIQDLGRYTLPQIRDIDDEAKSFDTNPNQEVIA
ncbi:MAG: hypothetical protein ACYDEV_04420 [Acidiferrobacter sp.]